MRGRGSSGPAGSGSGGTRSISVPGPVQPVALFPDEDPQDQLYPRPDIANVEDAEEPPAEELVDPKMAEAAAAMERITVEEPAKVKKGGAGKVIKVTSNYIRLVDLCPPSCSPSSHLLSSDWSW